MKSFTTSQKRAATSLISNHGIVIGSAGVPLPVAPCHLPNTVAGSRKAGAKAANCFRRASTESMLDFARGLITISSSCNSKNSASHPLVPRAISGQLFTKWQSSYSSGSLNKVSEVLACACGLVGFHL